MSIQFVIGATGTGKTHRIVDMMQHEDEGNRFYIVPEQFTLQAQQEVLDYSKAKGLLDIEVLSFNRLAYRFQEYLNMADDQPLDETGKSMLIRQIIEEHQEELVWVAKHRKKQAYMNELNSLIKECYQYNIEVDKLREMADKADQQLLKDKLHDLSIIFQYFKEKMSEGYITSHEAGLRLLTQFHRIQELAKTTVYIDEFYGFTPLQYLYIEGLLRFCKKVVISITLPTTENPSDMKNESDLYYESKQAISRLMDIAQGLRIHEEERIYCKAILRRQKSDLKHLVDQLYRYPMIPYDGKADSIRIVEATTVEEEVEAVALRIFQLIYEGKYRYKDIVVLTSELEAYESSVKKIFDQYGLNYFIDKKDDMIDHPFMQFLLSALLTVQFDFKYEMIFYHLKSLYFEETDSIDRIENYILAHGIKRRRQWEASWNELNEEKERIIGPLFALADALKTHQSVSGKMMALYNYIEERNVFQMHKTIATQYESELKLQEADRYYRVYDLVIQLMDEMVDMVGDERLSIPDFVSMLETGLTQIQMGQTPPSIDQLVVGDLNRTRFRECTHLFVLGMNEGKVPLVRSSMQLLTDRERMTLLELGLELAPDQKRSLFKEQMNIYMALTKVKRLLHLSYPRTDMGVTLRPAPLVIMIRKQFPSIDISEAEGIIKVYKSPTQPRPMFERLVRLAKQENPWKDEKEILILYNFYKKAYNEKMDIVLNPDLFVQGIRYANVAHQLEQLDADMMSSISELETYAACAYQHYLDYRLRIKERYEFVVTLPDIGILFHKCLEIYIRKCVHRHVDLAHIDATMRDALIQESVQEALEDERYGIFESSHRNRYLITKLTRILRRSIWGIERQLQRSLLRPKEIEYRFDGKAFPLKQLKLPIGEEHSMYLTGVVDRVDEYETDDTLYLSIVDYKSSTHDLDFNLIHEGIQLQLVIYLNVVEEIKEETTVKKVVPCGMYYYKVHDPMVPVDTEGDVEAEDKLLKQMRPKGLILHDETIVRMLDQELDKTSPVIPVTMTGKGISSRSSTIEEEDLKTVSGFTRLKAESIGRDIHNGRLTIRPYRFKGVGQCDYCPYRSICRFDSSNHGEDYHQIQEKKKEALIEAMKGEIDGRSH